MWETRFATPDYVFGTEPAAALRDHARLLVSGQRALAVADGEGRNSVFMAQQGVQVTAADYAPSALAKAQALAKARGVTVDFQQADLLAEWPEAWRGAFHLVVGIFIQFTGPADRAAMFAQMADCLRPGGVLFLHGYRPEQLAYGTGGPRAVENLYTEDMLRAGFPGWQVDLCRAYDREIQEGTGHCGMSALIDFIAHKPA
ncbi:MAG: Methyltransferase domain [Roseibaca calidilacus]|uniref:Methyltransferase domain n=1 Tax=Roseibaca calidilacus TaxID=1666912 RepID=A0A0P7YN69_9RHOB|nr:class I SAM-dependent methyltransferase [Roseibaca calidilacus]KPP91820.1 MAG: Methyltransferase domain [Roseibaca calidilacus]CUX82462.1 Methyltransferase domain-containing protein [Roseibaca calidilacus]